MTSNIVTKWQNTAAIIDLNSPLRQIFESKQIGEIKYGGYYIVNQADIWVFEEEFIDTPSHNLQQIFDKLCIKNYDNIQCFDLVTCEFKVVTESDAENYLKIISFNTINGIEYEKLKISLKLLSGGDYSSKSDRVRHLINIYVLLLLANRTKRQQNRLEFTFEGDLDSFVFKTEFGKQNLIDGLLEIYEWIVTEQEYSEAYKVKLQIVRSLILKQKKLDELDLIKNQAESIFNRIVSGKTDHYFELQNNLKDDFIKISTMISESNSSLNTKLFGWLTAFSLIIFDFIKKSDGQSIFGRIVCSTSEKTNVLLLLLIMALLIIMIMFNLDIRNIRKQYQCLKDLYVNQMFISKEEFNKFIKKPLYRNMYNLLLLSLLIILVIRLLIPMKYGCF
ncbi:MULTISPECIES: hypothetical protein [Streptococcus]|jgi:hypothetical protein|uniref:Uncharacterized protein n=1 Tax=Streptococcus mitis TaxID=28037 RepID=A0A7X1RJ37_STRMT|nr:MULTISPECIES: hypothetical protein [Streptococcus]MQQ31957.1 hypothetical protein [Streptococcus mitis]MQQ51034.1 hypothetical protein [Streptococcus mitis]OXT13184.1 hypothetical protein CBI42_06755 [Streptococcus sp. KR]